MLLTALYAALGTLAVAPIPLQADDAASPADHPAWADDDGAVASRQADPPRPPVTARTPSREAEKSCAASGEPQPAAVEARPNNWQRRHRASRIIGQPLCSLAGQKLGVVQDFVIDRQGRVAYGVVALGVAEGKLFLVPWRELRPHAAYDQFVLDISPEQLSQAPGFDADDWPDITDKRWVREVNRFYTQRSVSPRAIKRDAGTEKPAGGSSQRVSPREIPRISHSKLPPGMTQRARATTVPLQPNRQESGA
jgi:hypothetical protein